MEKKLKHLEFIQSAINRMNVNSFLIKGWTITIVAALFALSAKDGNPVYIFFSFFPPVMFWGLDSYYLKQDRLFRHLYNKIRVQGENVIDFDMGTSEFKKREDVKSLVVFTSSTLGIFYLSIIAIVTVILVFSTNVMPC